MSEKGLVLYGNGVDYNVRIGDKEVDAKLRGRLLHITKRSHHPVCAGDYVAVATSKDGTYFIDKVLPRKNKVSRPSNMFIRREQVLAANMDNLFIVSSVSEPPLNTGFIDRLLVNAEAENIKVYIVVNKADLGMTDEEVEICKEYEKIGYTVLVVSAEKNEGINDIRKITEGKVSVFIGKSGVGKSSILNRLDETVMQKVGKVSDYSSKGKHTTKQARMFELSYGGYLMDTPGIKEFGLWGIEFEDLKDYFPEMAKLSGECKYHNCRHINEPHCAVKDAVDEEIIPFFRYENYLKIYDSLEENKDIYFKKDK